MPGYSLLMLCRMVGQRMDELIYATATAAGTPTTLIAAGLRDYLPHDMPQFNGWVYLEQVGGAGADLANQGYEHRASTFTYDTSTLTFPVAWPTALTQGVYIVNRRYNRQRIVDAVNEAIAQLHLNWYREVVDESVTTASNTYRYELPANVVHVRKVEFQSEVSGTTTGYPFIDATPWGWSHRREADPILESPVNYLQLIDQLPSDRTLRVHYDGTFDALHIDSDQMPLYGPWSGAALAWLFDYAIFYLKSISVERGSSVEAERTRTIQLDRLMRAKERVLELAPKRPAIPLILPGRGEGALLPGRGQDNQDLGYLGAFHSGGRS
jgi:hypothetical protein